MAIPNNRNVRVSIPTPLRSYTQQRGWVDASGSTVTEILADLDAQFPGLRFRVIDEQHRLRKHMKIFVGQDAIHDLETVVTQREVVTLMQALSGG